MTAYPSIFLNVLTATDAFSYIGLYLINWLLSFVSGLMFIFKSGSLNGYLMEIRKVAAINPSEKQIQNMSRRNVMFNLWLVTLSTLTSLSNGVIGVAMTSDIGVPWEGESKNDLEKLVLL